MTQGELERNLHTRNTKQGTPAVEEQVPVKQTSSSTKLLVRLSLDYWCIVGVFGCVGELLWGETFL